MDRQGARPAAGGDGYVKTSSIMAAVRGRELEVLGAVGIESQGGRGHIRCPYADHGGDNDWRWDNEKKLAYCSCIGRRAGEKRAHTIIRVVAVKEDLKFEGAKVRIAKIIGRSDLIIGSQARKNGRTDATSLLNPPAENRDDTLVYAYLGHRLGIDPGRVPRPATKAIGIKALAYFDPPKTERGKPIYVGDFPSAVFETVDRDGKQHAHRIYLAPGGAGKADLGVDDAGRNRDAKKSAKKSAGDNTSGRSVVWGDPTIATTAILCEGIETGAAIAFAFAKEIETKEIMVAACITAGGVESFVPWPATKRVLVGADRDERLNEHEPACSRRGEIAARKFAAGHCREMVGQAALPVAIGLPGQPGEKIDWLDILRRDGVEAVRGGIVDAAPYVPRTEEIEEQRHRNARIMRLREATTTYPLPMLDSMRLEYRLTDRGEVKVHRLRLENGASQDKPVPIASPFGVTAVLRIADDADAYGLRVLVEDMSGRPRSVDFERGALARLGGSEIRAALLKAGLRVEGDGDLAVVQILKAARPSKEIIIISRPGWHRLDELGTWIFATPAGETYGAPGGCEVELAVNQRLSGGVAKAGSLDGWKAAIAAAVMASDCPHWTLGAAAPFAGPLLRLAGLDTCGINLSGLSSAGKTLAQMLAVSAWSSPDISAGGLLRSMRATENAIEGLAQYSNGTLLALDEMAHADGEAIGRIIYSIASGVGKARMNADASMKRPHIWSTFAFLSGESSLEEKVRNDGGQWSPGMAVRIPDVDVTGVNRAVEQAIIDRIQHVRRNYGHSGPAFIGALIQHDLHREPGALKDQIIEAARRLAGLEVDSAVIRAAMPFALLAVAGSLAQEFGILPAEAKIEGAVSWAWDRFKSSSDALVLHPAEQAIANIRAWVAERWNVTIKPVSSNDGLNNREAVAWYDETTVYLPTRRTREAAGGVLKELEIARALGAKGLLTRRHCSKRLAIRWVPNVGHVDCYALSRSEFGRTNRDQEHLHAVGANNE
jgi:hypothetical protein